MTSTASYSSGRLNGSASNTPIDNKWKRASMPVSDSYADFKAPVDLRGRSGSITSTASTAVIHRKSQYYESGYGLTREKVLRDSPIIAELRTNVIIKDEYTLVTDLSYHLATRYSKPDTAIMVNIDHSSCLALAGTFDPCYILTITSISTFTSPGLNKRNASFIQSFMADILSVPPERGIIKFMAMPEDNFAMNGSTVGAELERAERYAGAENGVKRAMTETRRTVPGYKRSTIDLDARPKLNGTTSDQSDKERKAERRRSAAPAAEVFELAAEAEPAGSTVASGVADDAMSTRSRPKSVAGQSIVESPDTDTLPSQKARHIAAVARSDTQQKAANMPKATKIEPKPQRPQSSGNKLTAMPAPGALKETIVENPKQMKDSDATANTSKRRSMAADTVKVPAPPPIPETKTPKVSKRKSFLAAFRL